MIRSKKNYFTFEEELFHPQCTQKQLVPSIDVTTAIELIVQGEHYQIRRDNPLFKIFHPMMQNIPITKIENNSVIFVTLPPELDKNILEIFFQWLTLSDPPQSKLSILHHLISASIFFNTKDILKRLLFEGIEPNIDKMTAIEIIKQYYPYIFDKVYGEFFSRLINRAIITASQNLYYVIYNMKDSLLELPESPFEEIIEKHFQGALLNTNIDHSLIMGVLMNKRGIDDIFELLENERKKSINKFEELFTQGIEPSLKWMITADDFNTEIYKESQQFCINNLKVTLISYYDKKNDTYSVALKIVSIKDEEVNITDNDIYKDDSCVSSNSYINNTPKNNNAFIISLLSICEICEVKSKSKINFNCIFSSSKTKVLISRIDNFSKKFKEANILLDSGTSFTLYVYFSVSYNFSSVLTHICKNFYQYYLLLSVEKIPKNVLNIILRNEELNIQSEDEVLTAVMNWLNHRNNVTAEMLLDITKNINWGLVSLEGFFQFFSLHGKIIDGNQELQSIAANEFNLRFKGENYPEDDSSTIDSKAKIKRKYIATSKALTQRNFSSDLLFHILKFVNKAGNNNTGVKTTNTNSNGNFNYNTSNSNNNINSISTGTGLYYYENSKIVSLNSSAQDSSKNSLSTSKAELIKSQDSTNKNALGKKLITPYSNSSKRDFQSNSSNYSSERVDGTNQANKNNLLTINREKMTQGTHNLSLYANKDKLKQPKNEAYEQTNLKQPGERMIVTNGQRLYPCYIKNTTVHKSKSLSNNHSNNHPAVNVMNSNKKKIIPNLIKIAKQESRENSLNKKLKSYKVTMSKSPNKGTNKKDTARSKSTL